MPAPTATAIYCWRCGAPNAADTGFCAQCGERVGSPTWQVLTDVPSGGLEVAKPEPAPHALVAPRPAKPARRIPLLAKILVPVGAVLIGVIAGLVAWFPAPVLTAPAASVPAAVSACQVGPAGPGVYQVDQLVFPSFDAVLTQATSIACQINPGSGVVLDARYQMPTVGNPMADLGAYAAVLQGSGFTVQSWNVTTGSGEGTLVSDLGGGLALRVDLSYVDKNTYRVVITRV